ncbi:MAG: hypothetical protein JWR86_546, partial [Enterovirga sp.]|nr:hypothetical protein [Enterovirga sp.]
IDRLVVAVADAVRLASGETESGQLRLTV